MASYELYFVLISAISSQILMVQKVKLAYSIDTIYVATYLATSSLPEMLCLAVISLVISQPIQVKLAISLPFEVGFLWWEKQSRSTQLIQSN